MIELMMGIWLSMWSLNIKLFTSYIKINDIYIYSMIKLILVWILYIEYNDPKIC